MGHGHAKAPAPRMPKPVGGAVAFSPDSTSYPRSGLTPVSWFLDIVLAAS